MKVKNVFFIGIAILGLMNVVHSACPNKCSGNGDCGADDKCSCYQNWLYGDCSQRQCPYTRAWVDTAKYSNDAHYYKECGGKGVCNRETGECECNEGFEGSGCRRMKCINDCSGHGTCETIEDLAKDNYDQRVGGTSSFTYTKWDQEKIQGCKCDPYWEGYGCGYRTCPKGDDALTATGVDMKQFVAIDKGDTNLVGASEHFYLVYHDPYGNSHVTEKIAGGSSKADICTNVQAALRDLPNNVLNTVVVSVTTGTKKFTRDSTSDPYTVGAGTINDYPDESGAGCVIQFQRTPGTTGLQHHLGCIVAPRNDAGNQPKIAGSSSWSCVTGEAITSAASDGTAGTLILTELAECGNRGICDRETGRCNCFSGHKGAACESQEALV